MKVIINDKEYDAEPFLTSPYDNPLNPKYVIIDGNVIPVDTIGSHRPLASKNDNIPKISKSGFYEPAWIGVSSRRVDTRPIITNRNRRF